MVNKKLVTFSEIEKVTPKVFTLGEKTQDKFGNPAVNVLKPNGTIVIYSFKWLKEQVAVGNVLKLSETTFEWAS